MPSDLSSHQHAAHRPTATRRGLGFESLEERRLLVVAVSGDPNDDAASLASYGGPGDPNLPGFDNVGRSSTGAASVFYLGGGWVITANHVTIANPSTVSPGGVFFGDTQYLVDTDSIHRLSNPDDSLADLKIFRIYGDPGLPAVLPSYLATAPPTVSDQVFLVGNGLALGDEHFWSLDTGQFPWVWTEIPEPPVPGPTNKAGFDIIGPRRIRWGENTIDNTNLFAGGVMGYLTTLDDLPYTGQAGLTHEAQATSGDSGGPLFHFVDGKWVLSGIIVAVSSNLSGQPSSTTLYDSQTLAADLSFYRDEILAVAGVVGRHVFYNRSAFDDNDPSVGPADDGAIATDKVAYLPGGGIAVPENATSYSRGINGILVDLASDHESLSIDDFTFRVGDTNTPSGWSVAPAPSAFTVRPGAGVGGADRVHFAWPDGAIANTWLEVTVAGNDAAGGFNTDTGLAVSDVFYFGNLIGDSFERTPETVFVTTSSDEIDIQQHIVSTAEITSPWDMDRNGVHLASDRIVTRSNTITALNRINISNPAAAPAAAPEVAELASAAIVFAAFETAAASPQPPVPVPAAGRASDEREIPRRRLFEQVALAADRWMPAGGDDDWFTGSDAAWLFDAAFELDETLPGPGND